MQKKQKIIITSIVIVVLTLVVAGIIFLFNKKAVGENSQAEKTAVEENIKKEDKDSDEVAEAEATSADSVDVGETELLDDSQAVAMKTTSNVNLRKEPSTDSEIIKVISKGTELKKYLEENGWAKVKCGEDVGYVSAEYLIDPAQEPEESEESAQTSLKVEAIPGQHRDPNSAVVVIDPGHQRSGDSTKEPNGPGSSVMKARVASGTSGVATGVAEYILNLDISLKLKTELENRGYTVYMTRSTHDVNISNMERAQYASSVGADIAVRIHANGASNASVCGAETLAPSTSNPYVSHLAAASQSLSKCIIDAYCSATGFKNRGVIANDTMTGINWSEVPVTILELGFMSNPDEDRAMQDGNMQNNMVQGIANGIDAYFGF